MLREVNILHRSLKNIFLFFPIAVDSLSDTMCVISICIFVSLLDFQDLARDKNPKTVCIFEKRLKRMRASQ